MTEREIALTIFIIIGIYLMLTGKINVTVSIGQSGINSHVRAGSPETPIKTQGVAVRILGFAISVISFWCYLYL
ncbi:MULTISPECIES: hypothetical protein [unclassified Pseudoalteromonas]|uniref:hypothetical protein n=1 Tax=unclassified Pseudoalteromonas TaxID=194690 RepID=UPI002573B8A3|nr:hypothetical protein [Pseudoalteromonas sp. MM1]BED91136.1 hypothetical protein PspMM1_36040 [Pseudoalteromonas sp. MM1]